MFFFLIVERQIQAKNFKQDSSTAAFHSILLVVGVVVFFPRCSEHQESTAFIFLRTHRLLQRAQFPP